MHPNKMRAARRLALLALLVTLPLSGFRCKLFPPKELQQAQQPVKLIYWRMWDDSDALDAIVAKYRRAHPNISVEVRKLRIEEFDRLLVDTFARGKDMPDLLSIPSTWMRSYLGKEYLKPMPAQVKIAYQFIQENLGFNKETITELRTNVLPTVGQIRDRFVGVVADDAVIDGKVYGLPLAVDTLAMYYNRDLLNRAGIAVPPTTWTDFQSAVQRLTYEDAQGQLTQAGAGIGGSDNVRHAPELLSSLMLQNGSEMVDASGRPAFDRIPVNFPTPDYHPGVEALKFYTDFSTPGRAAYTWNADLPDSLVAFANNQSAFFFGFQYDAAEIAATGKGRVNLGVARLPQIQGNPEVNVASYALEVVTSRTKHADEAWDFLAFASAAENVGDYLKVTGKPTALRALIDGQLRDDSVNIFAGQLLTAKSWYRGVKPTEAEATFRQMITSVLSGTTAEEAIRFAASRID